MPSECGEPLICRPYVEDELPSYEWIQANVAPIVVRPTELRPTQRMLDVVALLAIHAGQPCEGPDRYPHVVAHDGLWVHNGHHRWIVALLHGDPTITVRVVYL